MCRAGHCLDKDTSREPSEVAPEELWHTRAKRENNCDVPPPPSLIIPLLGPGSQNSSPQHQADNTADYLYLGKDEWEGKEEQP